LSMTSAGSPLSVNFMSMNLAFEEGRIISGMQCFVLQ